MRLVSFVLVLSLGSAITAVADGNSSQRQLPSHYYYFDQPIDLTLDTEHVVIHYTDAAASDSGLRSANELGVGLRSAETLGSAKLRMASLQQSVVSFEEIDQKLTSLAESEDVEFVSPVFVRDDGGSTMVTQDILVKLDAQHFSDLKELLAELAPNAEVIEGDFGGIPGAYRLRSKAGNGFDVLALANSISQDSRVEWAEPDFQCQVPVGLIPNDPYFYRIWGIHNTGQSGGVVDIDMDGPAAWDATIGSESVKVLVLDQGVEQDHPDINQLPGEDFTSDGGDGGPVNEWDDHGTAVAGCVSATINNDLGVTGIAPGCKVISARVMIGVNSYSGIVQSSWLVNALNWGCFTKGARVSSASIGMPQSSALTSMFSTTRAAGMVHFVSSGNDGVEYISYPGTLNTVNAVGGVTRWGTSVFNYGSALSFVGPAVDVYTTDRTGSEGYSSGDYTWVDGTSFSTPYTAGVAALFISMNPSLTAAEVEEQMRMSATDLGSTGFDNIFGWGLVNAVSADCNNNSIHDACDVSCSGDCAGVSGCGDSDDCQGDGIPDECQIDGNDCNYNNIPDECDALYGSSEDCNENGVPDECELDGNDCDDNDVPDDCDVEALIPAEGQPLSVDICSNGTVVFVVSADGVSPTYQWYKGGEASPVADSVDKTSGSQSDTLIIDGATSEDEGYYFCRVTDGCIVADSDSVELAIIPDPQITAYDNPTATCENGSVSFSIEHDGQGRFDYSYTWKKDGIAIASQPGGRTINLNNVVVGDSGAYTCLVENAECGLSQESPAMTLTVLGAVFTVKPAPQCRASSEYAVFEMEAESPGEITGYVWQKWYESYNLWINVSLQGGNDIQPLEIGPTLAEGLYRGGVYVDDACWSYTEPVAIQLGSGEADMDGDGDVDLVDMSAFVACFGVDSSSSPECGCANLNWANRVINLDDWAAFESQVTGP